MLDNLFWGLIKKHLEPRTLQSELDRVQEHLADSWAYAIPTTWTGSPYSDTPKPQTVVYGNVRIGKTQFDFRYYGEIPPSLVFPDSIKARQLEIGECPTPWDFEPWPTDKVEAVVNKLAPAITQGKIESERHGITRVLYRPV